VEVWYSPTGFCPSECRIGKQQLWAWTPAQLEVS